MNGEIMLLWGVAILLVLSAVAYLTMLTITSRQWRNVATASAVVAGTFVTVLCMRYTRWHVAVPVGIIASSIWSYVWWQATAVAAYSRKQRTRSVTAPMRDDTAQQ